MDGLIFLSFILSAALLALPVPAAFAALVVKVVSCLGLVRRQWSFGLLATASMALPPAVWLHLDRVEAARCQVANGPYDLSCGGELGGVFFSLFQIFLIIGGLVIGPFLGRRLHKRWAAQSQ